MIPINDVPSKKREKAATLSVCMIVRDEEPVLERCLDGVARFADELIIVDTGSVDATREIAKKFTDRVFDFPWIDDFAAARNAAYSHATMDYIMWLDADDVVEPQDAEKICCLKRTLPCEADAVFMLYGGDADQVNVLNNSRLMRDRWVRRSLGIKWRGRIHESLCYPPDAKVWFADDITLYHRKVHVNDPERNARIYAKVQAEGGAVDTRDLAFLCCEQYGKGQYEKAVEIYESLIDGDFSAFDATNGLCCYIWSMKALRRADALIASLERLHEMGVNNELLLCELGAAYLQRRVYDKAEHYLTLALETPVNYRDMATHFDACSLFLPCQKLSKLYSSLGDTTKAYSFHLRAEAVYPENPTIKINKAYFEGLMKPAE